MMSVEKKMIFLFIFIFNFILLYFVWSHTRLSSKVNTYTLRLHVLVQSLHVFLFNRHAT